MIKNIHLKNFQKHKNYFLGFSAITAIKGPSDSGKSSVIRALYWMAFNRPGGFEFIHHKASSCEVEMELENGTKIRRVKNQSGTINEYWLNDRKFVSFGMDVPQPIREALGLQVLNFQRQFDSPFLLGESAGEVGRRLNEFVDLESIHQLISDLNRIEREKARKAETSKKKIQRYRAHIRCFNELDGLRFSVMEAEAGEKVITESQRWFAALKTTIKQTEKLANLHGAWRSAEKGIYTQAKHVDALETQIQTIEKQRERLDLLEKEIYAITALEFNLRIIQSQKIDALEKETKQLERKQAALTAAVQKKKALDKAVSEIPTVTNWKSKIDKLETEFKKRFANKTCPICGGKINV